MPKISTQQLISALLEMNQLFSLEDEVSIYNAILEIVTNLMKANSVTLRRLSRDKKYLILRAATGITSSHWKEKRKIKVEESIGGEAIMKNIPIICEDITKSENYIKFKGMEKEGIRSIISVPITVSEKPTEVLTVHSKKIGFYKEKEMKILSLFAQGIAITIKNFLFYQKIRELTFIDELTTLYNRRYFNKIFPQEVKKASRYDYPLSIAFGDLDNFKKYNDKLGHSEGDKLLKKIGKRIKKVVRYTDIICRYGGDEFVIVLPFNDKSQVYRVCEKLKKEIAEITKNADIKITVSFGTATFDSSQDDQDSLLKKADEALYLAKKQGKNSIVQY